MANVNGNDLSEDVISKLIEENVLQIIIVNQIDS